MFSCFPRNLTGIGIQPSPYTTDSPGDFIFKIDILERHPFTTQTFSPLGQSSDDPSTAFLVIVAPSLPDPLTISPIQMQKPPDISQLRAFIAKGNQAVTYGPGTWHAPMVVLGSKRVDFLVTQFSSGVAGDDCQEVLLGENGVGVSLKGQGLDFGIDAPGKAKL